MKNLIVTTTLITALAATPAYAWEMKYALLAGQVWNGTSSTFTSQFSDKPACEAAFAAYKADGQAKIATARPGATGNGVLPVFWHVCSQLNSAIPS